MAIRQRQACDRVIYCFENLFLLKLFSSTLLILSVREAVCKSPYKAITLNGNQILRSRIDLQDMMWERKMEVERTWGALEEARWNPQLD